MKPKRKKLTVAELPPNLSLTEAAAQLRVTIATARRMLDSANYKWQDGRLKKWDAERRSAASKIDWSRVDWSRSDLALQRKHGVSRQRFHERRKELAPEHLK